ncbi:MAG: membrane protein insertase YidC [Deltaproteobacteria bacterium]|nr:membrane protein insertase YidC [Deltaproteobacteria bacterium]
MDNRTILAIALSIGVLLAFQFFISPLVTPPKKNNTQTSQPVSAENRTPAAAKTDAAQPVQSATAQEKTVAAMESETSRAARDVVVDTPLYSMVLSEKGAVIRSLALKKYLTSQKDGKPIEIIHDDSALLLKLDNKDTSNCVFDASSTLLKLNEKNSNAELSFTCGMPGGGRVVKTFGLHANSYWIDIAIRVSGMEAQSISLGFQNDPLEKAGQVFAGPVYYSKGSINELELKKSGERKELVEPVEWMGYSDHYFLTSLVTKTRDVPWRVAFERINDAGAFKSELSTASGQLKQAQGETIVDLGAYIGPKEYSQLKAVNYDLTNALYFGWFDVIAKPLLLFLNFIHDYIPNYGVAIILITVIIKILFWPLAHKSAKSMKTLQKIQPKLAKLKEKYGDDKEKLNKELMQLYKTYNVNPMGGCLPMLLQIPVFFALYKVLLQSIEIRHAPFALWITDLSAPDRLMIPGVELPWIGGIPVLTLLMGASMYLQQRLTPTAGDPTQAMMMRFLPLVFTFMFINFPSGLVLYWFVNNVLSIVQQYYTNKTVD